MFCSDAVSLIPNSGQQARASDGSGAVIQTHGRCSEAIGFRTHYTPFFASPLRTMAALVMDNANRVIGYFNTVESVTGAGWLEEVLKHKCISITRKTTGR